MNVCDASQVKVKKAEKSQKWQTQPLLSDAEIKAKFFSWKLGHYEVRKDEQQQQQ